MGARLLYRLVRRDAFEWLGERKPESIHAVVTDPPFGLVEYEAAQLAKRDARRGGIWRLPHSFDGRQRLPLPRFTVLRPADRNGVFRFQRRLATELAKVLVPGGHVLIASQNLLSHLTIRAFVGAGFEMRGQIARVVKTLRGGDRPKNAHEEFPAVSVSPRSCWEPWLLFRKPFAGTVSQNLRLWSAGGLRRPPDGRPFSDLLSVPPARPGERRLAPHPSLKPQLLMRQLVWAVLPLGRGLILDPFMGSGSTIAAATALGLRSIGIEKSYEYFEMAKRAVPRLAALEIPFRKSRRSTQRRGFQVRSGYQT